MSQNSARTGWADFLRCLAALAVVALHISGHFAATLPVTDSGWATAVFAGSLTRWAVPVFVMLSGMFLLDPERSFEWERWRRRVIRLAVLTAAAVYLYALWDTRSAHLGAEHLLEALVLFVRGEFHYHLWFLPMLLGLYLLTPALRALVAGAERRTLWYAIALWAVFALVLPFVYGLVPGEAGLAWLERTGLYGVLGYAGYFLLGYLLKSCAPTLGESVTLFVLGVAGWLATFWGAVALSHGAGVMDSRFFSFFSPLVALTAATVFLAVRFLNPGRHPIWAALSKLTLWVYLLHPLVLELFLF